MRKLKRALKAVAHASDCGDVSVPKGGAEAVDHTHLITSSLVAASCVLCSELCGVVLSSKNNIFNDSTSESKI